MLFVLLTLLGFRVFSLFQLDLDQLVLQWFFLFLWFYGSCCSSLCGGGGQGEIGIVFSFKIANANNVRSKEASTFIFQSNYNKYLRSGKQKKSLQDNFYAI